MNTNTNLAYNGYTGGSYGRLVKVADFMNVLNHPIISLLCLVLVLAQHMARWRPSQVLLAGMSGGFSHGSSIFAPLTDWPVS